MFRPILLGILTTTLATLGLTLPARADYYRGRYRVEDVEKNGLRMKDVRRGDVVEVEFHYVPNVNSYVVFEPKPGRPEQFWQHANGLIQKIDLPEFFSLAKPTTGNYFDRKGDRVSIQNVIDIPDFKLSMHEEFEDRYATGVSKRISLFFDVPSFEVDRGIIADLTLLNGQWETLPAARLELEIQDVTGKKPRSVLLTGTLLELECLAGSCARVSIPKTLSNPEEVSE